MSGRPSATVLRDMVREILNDVLAEEVAARVAGAVRQEGAPEIVTVASQADLDAAIRRLLGDASNPERRQALERGEVRFVFAGPSSGSTSVQSQQAVAAHRVERGAVTERHVKAAAESGAVIVTATRVVITPLAKDRARALGVVIRKDS